jgi:solute carrier family 25 phosphate transporter 23/24/25/41
VCAPLERVKLLNQVGDSRGLVEPFRKIYAKDGVAGYWRGCFTNCLRVVPFKALSFGTWDFYRSHIARAVLPAGVEQQRRRGGGGGGGEEESRGSKAMVSALAGFCAGFTATFACYPLDLARTRQAAAFGSHSHRTLRAALLLTIKEESFFKLWRGLNATVIATSLYESIKFGIFDLSSNLLLEHRQRAEPQREHLAAWEKLMCGATSGVAGSSLLYPMGVIKKRLMMQGLGGAEVLYSSALDCGRKLIAQGGVGVLYRGMGVNLLRAVPSTAIQFYVFGTVKERFFKQQQAERDAEEAH